MLMNDLPVAILTPEVLDVALSMMEGLDCGRSLTVAILLRHGDADQIVRLRADPKHYIDEDEYLLAVAATDFLRKYDGFKLRNPDGSPLNRESIATEKWWWGERQCSRTNLRLDRTFEPWLTSPDDNRSDVRWAALLAALRKNVEEVIGAAPPATFDGRFGPGATVSDPSSLATVPDKMTSSPTFTPNALFHLVPWTGTAWAHAQAELGRSPTAVRGGVYFTVPKDALTDRSCEKQPSLNGFYQLGLGRVLKKSLKRAGLDLYGGKHVHMQVACRASKTRVFCTIDLTSASDCIAKSLVRLALPHKWFQALNSLRTPFTQVDGKWVYLEKFSSMGNGFTFELETLLFAAIVKTAVEMEFPQPENWVVFGVNCFVYGDDIIVPTEWSKVVLAALKFFGFTPNERKTFVEGNFRESCGGDYWNGVSVRPHYLESNPNEPQDYIALANGLRRLARQGNSSLAMGDRLRKAWFKAIDCLPSEIRRCRGPEALGDIVIHDDESRWTTCWASGPDYLHDADRNWSLERQWRFLRAYLPASFALVKWEGFAYEVQMASCLYGIALQHLPQRTSEHFDARGLIPRDGVTGYTVGWVAYS